jgi:hypothetical protein
MNAVWFAFCVLFVTLAIYVLLDQWQQRGFVDVPDSFRYLVSDVFPRRRQSTKRTGESICRETLEQIYRQPFPACRPTWLRNPETNRCMELDCYNDALRLAVEYDGEQHFVFPNTFHRTEDDFRKQLRRDARKRELCRQYGIRLINVPYTVPLRELPEYLERRLQEIGML